MSGKGASRLMLDTHVWFWWALGNEDELSIKTRNVIEDGAECGGLRVSVMSVWEIAMLNAKGRLRLHLPCRDWVRRALALPGLELVGMTPAIAVESNFLPDEFHSDPADRILVATARLEKATLLTRDGKILEYGRRGHVTVLPV